MREFVRLEFQFKGGYNNWDLMQLVKKFLNEIKIN